MKKIVNIGRYKLSLSIIEPPADTKVRLVCKRSSQHVRLVEYDPAENRRVSSIVFLELEDGKLLLHRPEMMKDGFAFQVYFSKTEQSMRAGEQTADVSKHGIVKILIVSRENKAIGSIHITIKLQNSPSYYLALTGITPRQIFIDPSSLDMTDGSILAFQVYDPDKDIRIGRDSGDLQIHDEHVSRTHCAIVARKNLLGRSYYLVDLNSTNSTGYCKYGESRFEKVTKEIKLGAGDRIRVPYSAPRYVEIVISSD